MSDTSSSQPVGPISDSPAAASGGVPEPGGGEAPPGSGQSDSPETLLENEARRKVIDRFNALPLEQKAQAMALKRSLKISNWFTARPEIIAQILQRIEELESASA